MILLFTDALVIAGPLTLVPGRLMHRVIFAASRAVSPGLLGPCSGRQGGGRKSLEKQSEKALS